MNRFYEQLGVIAHLFAGFLPLAWHLANQPPAAPDPHPVMFLAIAFFALAPDLDTNASHIGRLLPQISRWLESRVGHRSATHSLAALSLVAAVTFITTPDDGTWRWLTAAYASHLLLDMIVGESGVPLFYPWRQKFSLIKIARASRGELIVTAVLAITTLTPFLLPPVAQRITTATLDILPTPLPTPSPIPLPTPTPHLVHLTIQNVYNIDTEILTAVGESIAVGDLIADLSTHRALNISLPTHTPTPLPTQPIVLPTQPATPTPFPTADPLFIAQLENELNLARSRYRAIIATTTPDAHQWAIISTRESEAEDRENCIAREGVDDWRGWNCQQELDTLQAEIAERRSAAAPLSADPLTADTAYHQFRAAEIRYEQAIAQLTPIPTPLPTHTHTPTPLPTHTPLSLSTPIPTLTAADETRVRSLVEGVVVAIEITAVRGNAATVDIVVLIGGQELPVGGQTPEIGGQSGVIPETAVVATVLKVSDGDTFKALIGGQEETIRLLGVDTPETVHPTKPVECYGPEASSFTKAQLPIGGMVYIELDELTGERDRYGRLLAHVWLANGTLHNEQLIAQGYAIHNDYGNRSGYKARYTLAEVQAQRGAAGVWSVCG